MGAICIHRSYVTLMNDEDKLIQDLANAFAGLNAEQTAELSNFREMRVVAHALLHQEAKRLQTKLGIAHPRVQALEAGLERNLNAIHDLDVELEVATIRMPQIDKDEALVQGRVMDENRRGISGLTICLQDSKERLLHSLGKSITDASGYYAIKMGKEMVDKMPEAGVSLVVRLNTRRIVYSGVESLAVTAGQVVTANVRLNRNDISPPGGAAAGVKAAKAKREPATPPAKEENSGGDKGQFQDDAGKSP